MKPGGMCFDSAWRLRCSVEPCAVSDVDDFIRRHYLGKRPAIVMLALMLRLDGMPVGCIIYSAPPREADRRYGGITWELARLFLVDEMPRNSESWLISQSIRHIRRNRPDVAHLLSYADPSAGHAGVIYKAANWRFDGMTDQERKTPRCDYIDQRTGKKYGRKGNMPPDAIVGRVPRVSKHRFHYPMTARAT
jgi:hypothetical protein